MKDAPYTAPELRAGMLVEVLTAENRLGFLARVVSYTGDLLVIQDAQGREMAPAVYNRDVKLRLAQNGVNCIILGKICGSTSEVWRVDRLQKTVLAEKREYFRQPVRSSATVQCLKRSALSPSLTRGVYASRCSILDISASGILIKSSEPFQLGDLLSLSNVRLSESEAPFRFRCFVQRSEPSYGRDTEFGCQFEPMEQREQDRLLRTIFAIQRQEIQKSRSK